MRRAGLFTMVPLALLSACGGADLLPIEEASEDGQEVSAAAVDLLQARGTELGLDRFSTLRQTQRFVDELGLEHVRFERSWRGLQVRGGDFIAHPTSATLAAGDSFTAPVAKPIALGSSPALRPDQASDITMGAASSARMQRPERTDLVVYAYDGPDEIALAYDVVARGTRDDGTPSVLHTYVDANSGRVLNAIDEIQTEGVVGTGKGIQNGSVQLNTNRNGGNYELKDTLHGNGETQDLNNGTSTSRLFSQSSNAWGDGTKTLRTSAAVDAHYGAGKTWDYYKTVHGRNGIGNDGKAALTRVHYSTNYNNAFWSDGCFCMTYGDGDGTVLKPLVSLDVAAHEMTHGVTSRTAKLVYSNESGGLNEATSDIFGTAVEFYAANASDPGDYLIGEKVMIGSAYLRSMIDPAGDKKSADHYSKYKRGMDVHYSSGIANQFFYLLSEGGKNKTSGKSVTGITRAKAEKIWYRALTTYFASSTTYKQARGATLSAAKDLYGATSTEYKAVNTAWDAVGVN